MTLDDSVTADTGSGGSPECSPYGWDWTATTHAGRAPREIARELLGSLDPATVVPGKGIQGWSRSVSAFDAEGYKLGTVYLGGRDDVQFLATSAAADAVRDHVVTVDGGRTSRVDTRVDSLAPFDELAWVLEAAADRYGSKIGRVEYSVRGKSLGRTVYLGAPSSAVRVRLYEKWLESPGQYVEGTNRVEVQLRPASAVKARVSSWSRAQTFCASKVTRQLAEQLGAELVDPVTLHVAKGTPDLERTLQAMGKQYGPAVDRFVRQNGGDMTRVLDWLVGETPRGGS